MASETCRRGPTTDSPDLSVFDAASLAVPVEDIRRIAKTCYGLEGRIEPLSGETDRNFKIVAPEGRPYILKVAHQAEDLSIVRNQNAALLFIAEHAPDLPVPRVVPDRLGRHEQTLAMNDGPPRNIRLLSYLEGRLLVEARRSDVQVRNFGAMTARLAVTLRDFVIPVSADGFLWDLMKLERSAPQIERLDDLPLRALVQKAYDNFFLNTRNVLAKLPSQTIHNDLNAYNVVVDPSDDGKISGFLDFGDMNFAPVICEVAIAASGLVSSSQAPLVDVGHFIRGFASVRPLSDIELSLLFDLLQARLAQSIVIPNWQAQQFPHNSTYVMRSHQAVIDQLRSLDALGRTAGTAVLRQALIETRSRP